MSENIKMEDIIETPTSEVKETEVVTEVDEQDPLKTELEKVKSSGRTEAEKAAYTLKKNAERLKELGGDPVAILGIKPVEDTEEENEDDKPLTIGMYKQIQSQASQKTALQLADEIQNDTERELTKFHIENTIKSTGNPSEDLRLARMLVNSVKNTKILEELNRKGTPSSHSSASGAPAKDVEVKGDLTTEELAFMKPPFNLTKEQIIKARG